MMVMLNIRVGLWTQACSAATHLLLRKVLCNGAFINECILPAPEVLLDALDAVTLHITGRHQH